MAAAGRADFCRRRRSRQLRQFGFQLRFARFAAHAAARNSRARRRSDIFGEDGSLSGRGGAGAPENWLTKKAYSPVRVDNQTFTNPDPGHPLGVPVKNRFDHTDFSESKIRWSIGAETGEQSGPALAPHSVGWLAKVGRSVPAPP